MAGNKVSSEPDVELKVGEYSFPCHRELLSQCSPYFQAMFSQNFIEKDQRIIEIKDVEPEAMKVLLGFVETNEIPRNALTFNGILSLLKASNMLQFETVQAICTNAIAHEWLSVDTCLQTMATAGVLDQMPLFRKSKAIAFWEFSSVKTTAAFFELPIETLEDYLGNDGLNTKQGEFEVFDAGLSWLQEDPENRKQYILRVLECVRFSDISASDIRTMFLYPYVTGDQLAFSTLQCVLRIKQDDLLYNSLKNSSSCTLQKDISEVETPRESTSDISVQKQSPSFCLEFKCCRDLNHGHRRRRYSESSHTSEDHAPTTSDTKCFKSSCCGMSSRHTRSWPFCKEAKSHSLSNSSNTSNSMKCAECDVSVDNEREQEVITGAMRLLARPPRHLPLVPCIIGHRLDRKSKVKLNSKNSDRACVVCFDDKVKRPVPLLFLTKVNDGPVEPTGYKVITKGQDLYVIGGEYLLGYGNWNSTIWKYSIWQEKWTCETSLPNPRRHHSVCVLDDDIYIIGGFGRHRVIMDSVEKYNTVSKSWSKRASLPSSMYSAACCVHKGNIYVFGLKMCYYHVKEDVWHTFSIPSVPNNMTFNSAMSCGEWIYLTDPYAVELIRFSPEKVFQMSGNEKIASCQKLGNFLYRPLSTCLVNGKIYSFATEEEGILAVEVYDINENTFQLLWEESENDAFNMLDFSPKNCIGCFPLIVY